tara:strand:- start:271 stop:1185 length:915 start_codon:yes stop_codon:yes gene_type:complete
MAGVRPDRLSLSQIKSRLLNVAQSSLYRVTLPIPSAVRMKLGFSSRQYENINLMCCEAALPGSSLTTHEVTNDYAGVTEKMAYRRLYDETLALAFYVDRNYSVLKLFECWMDYISGVDNTYLYESPNVSYRMAYPKTYKNNIFLTKFEKDHFVRDYSSLQQQSIRVRRNTLDYTFVDAFPLTLTSIPVSYEGSQALKVNVAFNFVRYVQQRRQSLLNAGDVSRSDEEFRSMILNEDNTALNTALDNQYEQSTGYSTPGQELGGKNMWGRALDAGFAGANPNPFKVFNQEYWDTLNAAKHARELS